MYKELFDYFTDNNNVYLDNAATTQKPKVVLEIMNDYYMNFCANTHRSNYSSANKATTLFEEAREYLQNFINAKYSSEIVFTKGVTESINFIASSYVLNNFKTVIISSLEHHSNIVPWHMQGRSLHKGLEVVNCDDGLNFDIKHFEELLKKNPKSFVSITHISNAFGKILPIKKITQLAHKYDSVVLVDGAQSLSHIIVDVKDLDVDFYAISSHKSFGPTGVGAIYIKEKHLKDILPYQTGGATINKVTFDKTILLDSPYKFEAGTQNIAGVLGFAQALKFINKIGYEKISQIDNQLYSYLRKELSCIENIKFYSDETNSVGSLSFNINGLNHEDIGILLDKQHILVRSGHHCAQPIMQKLGIDGTIRVSLAFYNDKYDINKFIQALNKAVKILGK